MTTRQKLWERRITYRRKARAIEPKKKYLVVTEGATEAEYFKQFNCYPYLIIITIDGQDSKKSLVEKAIAERAKLISTEDFYEGRDETWVVFDRDVDSTNSHDKDNFNQAISLAGKNGISVAYSNDAVELWFLLHFQEVSSAMHRSQLNKALSKHINKSYKKGKGAEIYHAIKDKRADAIKRAKALDKTMKDIEPCDANPCTKMYILVEKIISEDSFRED